MRIYRLVYLEGGPKGGYSAPKDRIRFRLGPLHLSVSQNKEKVRYKLRSQARYDALPDNEKSRYWSHGRPEIKESDHVRWRIEFADVQWHVLEEGDTRDEC